MSKNGKRILSMMLALLLLLTSIPGDVFAASDEIAVSDMEAAQIQAEPEENQESMEAGFVGEENPAQPLNEETGTFPEDLPAQWPVFRKDANNMAVVDCALPDSKASARLKWGAKIGSGWGGNSVNSPIIVDGCLVVTQAKRILKINRENGEIVQEGTMAAASAYGIVPPTYADGMLFVPLAKGTVQAFDAHTLQSLWIYHDEMGGQGNSTIAYSNGYIYVGFWNGESKDANFACIYAGDEDPSQTNEEKKAVWTHAVNGGYYWAGAYAEGSTVVVGSDDGSGEGNYIDGAALFSFNKLTGEIAAQMDGFNGDIRSNIAYDSSSGRVYFTSKGGYLYSVVLNADGTFGERKSLNLGGMSTSTPVIYNGRAYVGVSGPGQFGTDGHQIAAVNIAEDSGEMSLAYSMNVPGYPQTSGLLSTVKDANGCISVYFADNTMPGGLYILKDKPGLTAPGAGSGCVFEPQGSMAQYCLGSPICDEEGVIYYKNDSGYLMAVEQNNAYLADAAVSGRNAVLDGGAAFDGGKEEHEIIAGTGDEDITLTVTPAEGAQVTIDGQEGNSAVISLTEMEKTITVEVVNGSAQRTYTFLLRTKRNNASLELLRANASNGYNSFLTLTPEFDREVFSYTAAYNRDKTFLNVWPKAEDANAEVKVFPLEGVSDRGMDEDGSIGITASSSGNNRYAIYFADGYTTAKVKIRVTAEDKETVKEYELTLSKPPVASVDTEQLLEREDNSLKTVVQSSASGTLYYTAVRDTEAAPDSIDKSTASAVPVTKGSNEVTFGQLPCASGKVYFVIEDAAGNTGEMLSADFSAVPMRGLSLSQTKLELGINQTKELAAASIPEDPSYLEGIVWSSDRPEIASVKNGVVTGVVPGKAVITASVDEFTASCEVEVLEAPSIKTTLEDQLVQRGSRKTFDVWARDAKDKKLAAVVKFDGKTISYNWNDNVKTSYTLNFAGMENGEHTVEISTKDALGQTASVSYTIQYDAAKEGELIGYAAFSIEASTISCGYIVEPSLIPIYEGENAAMALVRLLQENGYDLRYTGTLENSFYISAVVGANAQNPLKATKDLILDAKLADELKGMVTDFDAEKGTEGSLGEFNYNSKSGWMYCLNNVFPNVGFGNAYLTEKDVVRMQFTLAYGSDIGGGFAVGGGSAGAKRADKDALTYLIATVNSAQNRGQLLQKAAVKSAYENAEKTALRLGASQEEVDQAKAELEEALKGSPITGITLTEHAVTLQNMESRKLTVAYTPENPDVPVHVTWSGSNSDVVSVAADGTVTAKAAGTAVITAAAGDFTDTCTVTVPETKLTAISLPETCIISRGGQEEMPVAYAPVNTTDDRTVSWSSADPDIADVSGGVVMGVSEGTTTITAQVGEFRDTCEVTVKKVPITEVRVDETNIVLQKNKTARVTAQVLPENTTEDKTVTMVSMDTSVATVSGTSIRGVAFGETDVLVRAGGKAAIVHVTVREIKAESFTVKNAPGEILAGKSASVSLVYEPVSQPDDYNEAVWTSSDTSVVTVTKEKGNNNTLKGISTGKATITVTLGDMSRSFEVEVKEKPLETIAFRDEEVVLYAGTTTETQAILELSPSGYTNSERVSFEIADENIAVVSRTSAYAGSTTAYAYLKAVSEGETVLTARVGELTAAIPVKVVKAPEISEIAFSEQSYEGKVGGSLYLSVSAEPAEAPLNAELLQWETSDSTIVQLAKTTGKSQSVSLKKMGTATITVTYDGSVRTSCEIAVMEYPLKSVYFSKETYTETTPGKSASLSITTYPTNCSETVTYSAESSDENVAVIKSCSRYSVSVQPVNPGTAAITVTASSSTGTYTGSMEYTYAPAYVENFSFAGDTVYLSVGKSFSLRKGTHYAYIPLEVSDSSISWSSSNTDIFTISSYGSMKGIAPGEAELLASLSNGTVRRMKVVVFQPCTSLTLGASRIGMHRGDSVLLETLTCEPETAGLEDLAWMSEDEQVVKIRDGRIHAVGLGSTRIIAMAGNTGASCEITVTASDDELEAIKVMALIDRVDELLEITEDAEDVIAAARSAYDTLTRKQKSYVENDEVLFHAETQFAEVLRIKEEQEKNQMAASAVVNAIAAIGEVELESRGAIEDAREQYEALSAVQKELVSNYSVLTSAETKLEDLERAEAEQQAAENALIAEAKPAVDAIAAIGDVTLESETAIQAARAAYEKLSDAAKAKVTNLSALVIAEKDLELLKAEKAKENQNQAAAAAISSAIAAIGEVKLESRGVIEAARAGYASLSEEQKALVTNYTVLTEAEGRLKALEDEKAQKQETENSLKEEANPVIEAIAALGTVTLKSETAIQDARAAYEKLSDAAKKKVENLSMLTIAEKELAVLKEKEERREEAEKYVFGGEVKSVEATAADYQSARITWNRTAGADGYCLYYSETADGSWNYAVQIENGSTLSYTMQGLETGTTVYYRLRAYRNEDGVKVYGPYSEIKSAKPVPGTAKMKAVRAKKGKTVIKWSKVKGADGYCIYGRTSKKGKWKLVKRIKNGKKASFIRKGKKGRRYYYRVCAYQKVNGKLVYGAYSKVKSAKVR